MTRTDQAAIDHSPVGRVFELPGAGRALFTGREQGNMSSVGGERSELAPAARESLRAMIGARQLVRGYQVHGSTVRRVTSVSHSAQPPAGAVAHGSDGEEAEQGADSQAVTHEADGQATALAGVATMVLSADCLPVALGCEGAVAMVHAGWRGLAAGVLEEGVRAVAELGDGGEIVAIVGPCAGGCCYEVGPEVHDVFGGAHRDGPRIDLRAIAHDRLLAAGVEQVRHQRACTICDERFFSHRREGARAGRQAGVAWLS
jgi:polyphenol oxidase